jgi:hypothetical protein
MNKPATLCIALFALIPVSILAQTKNEFSVKQAVDYGIKNSPIVKNALLDNKIQQENNREFTAIAYPQLNGTAGVNDYFDIPKSLLGGNAVSFGTKFNANAGFDLNQILFDGQVFIGLKARSTAVALSAKTAEVTAEQIKANIYKIYYQLVVGKKQMGSIDANIERFEKLLADVTAIFKNGFAEKLDIDKTQVQLNNLKNEKLKIQNMLDAGNAGLKFLMNMPQKEALVLTDTLSETELKSNILEEAYNYNDRKDIQLLTIASKLNSYNVKRFELSKLPSLALNASYSKNAQRNNFNFFNKGDWFTTSLIGVRLTVPIFDGFARRARVAAAKLAVNKIDNTLLQTKELMDNEVTQSRIKMKTAMITMDNQKQNIELAEQVFNTTKKKFEQGLGNNQEIYNAQTELKVAQTDYYNAIYDAIIAKIDYLKAVGKL